MGFNGPVAIELAEWRIFKLDEDFVGGSASTSTTIGENGWSHANSGGSTVIDLPSIDNHPGIKRVITGSPNTSRFCLYLASGPAGSGSIRPTNINKHGAIFRPISTTAMRMQVGMASSQDVVNATDFILVDFNTSGSSFYTTTTKTSGSTETYNAPVTPISENWILVEWVRNTTTGHLTPYINNVAGTVHTSSLPTDTSIQPVFNLFTNEVAVKQADIDAFWFETVQFSQRWT